MRNIYYILTLFILTNCGNGQRQNENVKLKTTDTTETDNKEKRYTEQQLESFIDSIGSLSPLLWTDTVAFAVDSTFKNQLQMNKVISEVDFNLLKRIIQRDKDDAEIGNAIDIKTARRIFGEIEEVQSCFIEENRIPINFISFDKKKEDLNQFAIYLGELWGWNSILYFFKGNQIIAKQNICHRGGLSLEHYKDFDGKTIVYYKEHFVSGTGAWHYNFFFYKYYKDRLIPILNLLQNGNLNGWGSRRSFWLESFVTNTAPLTIKMEYWQDLIDTNFNPTRIIDDTTLIQFSWDEKTKTLVGNYEKDKINKYQTLTYYLTENEFLFINTYYSTLKDCLKDKTKRNIVLNYLNGIKNYYENK